MNRMRVVIMCGAALLLTWHAWAAGATDRAAIGNVTATVLSPGPGEYRHGYKEVRVRLENTSADKTHRVRLRIPGGQLVVQRTVDLPPLGAATVSLFALPVSCDARSMDVEVDGVGKKEVRVAIDCRRYGSDPRVLVSRGLKRDDLKDRLEKMSGSSSGSRSDAELVRSEEECAAWSEQWLAFSIYDGVVMTSGEIAAVPATVLDALWRYVECGGTLAVLGNWRPPDQWHAVPHTAQHEDEYAVGFGLVLCPPAQDVQALTTDHLEAMFGQWMETVQAWSSLSSRSDLNKTFPVAGMATVPVRSMLAILVAFAIVIGPVNVLVLARLRRRIWLLWTVPAISALTCAMLLAYALLSEGVTPTVRREALTILDEGLHRATTLGWYACYSPLTLGDGFHFGTDTELSFMGDYYGYGGPQRMVDWTDDQHLAKGFSAARLPTHMALRSSRSRRECLRRVRQPDGTTALVNGLGATIASLTYADADGNIYKATNITVGAEILLTNKVGVVSDKPLALSSMRKFHNDGKWKTSEAPVNKLVSSLVPGTYVAVLAGAPFVEQGVNGTPILEHTSVVLGFVDMPGATAPNE